MQKILDPISEVEEKGCIYDYKGVGPHCENRGCEYLSVYPNDEKPTGIKDKIKVLSGRFVPDTTVTLDCKRLDTSMQYTKKQ